ncbi:MAG TPA: hypothetical protein VHV78_12555 [Gemmatimonadaceae bacterium]|nr:hypothetical protein [Gemmatimonadaceae bacterium]
MAAHLHHARRRQRFCRLHNGVLTQLTVDQTMARVMIDSGAMSRETAESSRLENVLVSAVGSPQLDPRIDVIELQRGDVYLMCTDGLTRHVNGTEIAARLQLGGSADATCRDFVNRALERAAKTT